MSELNTRFPFKRSAASRCATNSSQSTRSAASTGGASVGKAHRMYDGKNLHVSLRQWRMLQAVVDCDGFVGAANYLHISQSAVSYAISKLQEQLGIPLLRLEGRKALVTESGRVLLNRSRRLMREAFELEALAEGLRNGLESEVSLLVDHNLPDDLLLSALRKFQGTAESVRLRLEEADATHAETALYDNTVDLAICDAPPKGFSASPLLDVEHMAVAHPGHALFRLERALQADDLNEYTEVVIAPWAREPAEHGTRWYVSGLDRALGVLREGFGYAWLPRHRVRHLLEERAVQVLPVHGGAIRLATLYLVEARSAGMKPDARKLAELLHEAAGGVLPDGSGALIDTASA